METIEGNIGAILGEIGCRFRGNIKNHIKDYDLLEEDNIEWLLEPLDLIKHPDNLVLDAFKKGDSCGWLYELYFHERGTTAVYVPYDHPIEWPPKFTKLEGNTIRFLEADEIERPPKPKPYDKSMLVKGLANWPVLEVVPKIWDDLSVPFTELGIWQAFLLCEAYTFMPKGWHGNYYNNTYVFSQNDMQKIIDDKKSRYDYTDEEIEKLNAYWKFLDMNTNFDQYKKSNYDRLVSYLGRDDIMPSVKINGDKAEVSYCYWNDWEGFCRRTIPVERRGQSVAIGKPEREVLVEYDCGIRF